MGTVTLDGKPAVARVQCFLTAAASPRTPLSWLLSQEEAAFPSGASPARSPAATVLSDGHGRFEVDGLKIGVYEMVAVSDRGARGRASAWVEVDSAIVHSDISLRGGQLSLSGRAVHADGRPFSGRIAAAPSDDGEATTSALGFVATDAAGRFTLAGLAAGSACLVAVDRDQFRSTSSAFALPYEGEFVFVVDPGLSEIAGRVVDAADGRPIPSASVTASAWMLPHLQFVHARATTDVEGRFRVLGVPGFESIDDALRVRAEGYVEERRPLPPRGVDTVIQMRRPARVHGRVLSDVDGAPLAGVDVYAMTLGTKKPYRWSAVGAHTTADSLGRYEIANLQGGSVAVCVCGGGWFSKDLLASSEEGFNPLVTRVEPGTDVTRELVASRCVRARGRVLDPAGSPVAGASVSWGAVDPPPGAAWALRWLPDKAGAGTDGRGEYTVDGLLPGLSYEFAAEADGFGAAKAPGVATPPGSDLTAEIHLGKARWFDALVLETTTEAPVPSARVEAEWSCAATTVRVLGLTDSAGRARLGPLPVGVVDVRATEGSHDRADDERMGTEGSTADLTWTFHMKRLWRIVGDVRYEDGTPAAGASIEWDGSNLASYATADPRGGFEIHGEGPGPYEVRAYLDPPKGPSSPTVTVEVGGSVDLVIPGAGPKPLLVHILDGNGEPVPAGKITTTGTAPPGSGPSPFWNGSVQMRPLVKPGWIEVYAASSADGTRLPWGAQLAGPLPLETKELTLRLKPERRIDGIVHDPLGKPVSGVAVEAEPEDEGGIETRLGAWSGDESHAAARTDQDGRFSLGGLWEGRYELSVGASEDYARVDPVVVEASASSVVIVLAQGRTVTPVVVDSTGKPVPSASVTLARVGDDGRQLLQDFTDERGAVRLSNLDPTLPYRLTVEPPEGVLDARPLVVGHWLPSGESLRLPKGNVLRGRVLDHAGEPSEAVVSVKLPDGSVSKVETDDDGAFIVGRLPPGDVVVYAVRNLNGHEESGKIALPSDAHDAVVRLAIGSKLVVHVDGWRWPQGDEGVADLVNEEFGGFGPRATVAADGTIAFGNLQPASSYALYLSCEAADGGPALVAYAGGLHAADRETRLQMEPGRTVNGKVLLPVDAHGPPSVRIVAPAMRLEGDVRSDGGFTIRGVPAGTWTLEVDLLRNGSEIHRHAEVPPGVPATIDLRAH